MNRILFLGVCFCVAISAGGGERLAPREGGGGDKETLRTEDRREQQDTIGTLREFMKNDTVVKHDFGEKKFEASDFGASWSDIGQGPCADLKAALFTTPPGGKGRRLSALIPNPVKPEDNLFQRCSDQFVRYIATEKNLVVPSQELTAVRAFVNRVMNVLRGVSSGAKADSCVTRVEGNDPSKDRRLVERQCRLANTDQADLRKLEKTAVDGVRETVALLGEVCEDRKSRECQRKTFEKLENDTGLSRVKVAKILRQGTEKDMVADFKNCTLNALPENENATRSSIKEAGDLCRVQSSKAFGKNNAKDACIADSIQVSYQCYVDGEDDSGDVDAANATYCLGALGSDLLSCGVWETDVESTLRDKGADVLNTFTKDCRFEAKEDSDAQNVCFKRRDCLFAFKGFRRCEVLSADKREKLDKEERTSGKATDVHDCLLSIDVDEGSSDDQKRRCFSNGLADAYKMTTDGTLSCAQACTGDLNDVLSSKGWEGACCSGVSGADNCSHASEQSTECKCEVNSFGFIDLSENNQTVGLTCLSDLPDVPKGNKGEQRRNIKQRVATAVAKEVDGCSDPLSREDACRPEKQREAVVEFARVTGFTKPQIVKFLREKQEKKLADDNTKIDIERMKGKSVEEIAREIRTERRKVQENKTYTPREKQIEAFLNKKNVGRVLRDIKLRLEEAGVDDENKTKILRAILKTENKPYRHLKSEETAAHQSDVFQAMCDCMMDGFNMSNANESYGRARYGECAEEVTNMTSTERVYGEAVARDKRFAGDGNEMISKAAKSYIAKEKASNQISTNTTEEQEERDSQVVELIKGAFGPDMADKLLKDPSVHRQERETLADADYKPEEDLKVRAPSGESNDDKVVRVRRQEGRKGREQMYRDFENTLPETSKEDLPNEDKPNATVTSKVTDKMIQYTGLRTALRSERNCELLRSDEVTCSKPNAGLVQEASKAAGRAFDTPVNAVVLAARDEEQTKKHHDKGKKDLRANEESEEARDKIEECNGDAQCSKKVRDELRVKRNAEGDESIKITESSRGRAACKVAVRAITDDADRVEDFKGKTVEEVKTELEKAANSDLLAGVKEIVTGITGMVVKDIRCLARAITQIVSGNATKIVEISNSKVLVMKSNNALLANMAEVVRDGLANKVVTEVERYLSEPGQVVTCNQTNEVFSGDGAREVDLIVTCHERRAAGNTGQSLKDRVGLVTEQYRDGTTIYFAQMLKTAILLLSGKRRLLSGDVTDHLEDSDIEILVVAENEEVELSDDGDDTDIVVEVAVREEVYKAGASMLTVGAAVIVAMAL